MRLDDETRSQLWYQGKSNARAEFRDWIPDGFQENKVRRPQKSIPDWAGSERKLKQRILGPSLRRYKIAYLYFRMGYNAREVAAACKMKVGNVQRVIYHLRNGSTE